VKYALLLIILIAIPCWSQTTTGKAETTGPCSPAVTGGHNQFRIICQGISKEQGAELLRILNKISRDRLDTKSVMDKLDEIEKEVRGLDPTVPVITYMYDGDQRITRPGQISDNQDNPAFKAFLKIKAADSAHDWQSLVSICDDSINKTPKWLTPYLYKGLAYANLGRMKESLTLLEDVKKMADGNHDYDLLVKQADELLQKIHSTGY